MLHATVDAGLARSQIIHWFGFAAATLAATFSAMPVATALAALMPFAAAPVVAAAGALGAGSAGLRNAQACSMVG